MKNINWWMIFSIAVLIAWGFREGCGCGKRGAHKTVPSFTPVASVTPGKDTVTIIDTQYVPEPKGKVSNDVTYEPKAQGLPKGMRIVDNRLFVDYKIKPLIYDDSTVLETIPPVRRVDTTFYRDSLPVDHGYALITDTISDNRITGRRFSLRQSLPIIKETTVVPAKPRNVLYAGISAAGGKENYLYSVEGSLALKARNDKIYALGVGVTEDNQVLFRVGWMLPVRLRK